MRTSSRRQVQNEAKFEAKNRLVINKMIVFLRCSQASENGAKV